MSTPGFYGGVVAGTPQHATELGGGEVHELPANQGIT
jgi:hypothetical protein